jgi:predicted aspartyl protease
MNLEESMGITFINATVTGPHGRHTLDFLVDSGAMYTLLPFEIWQEIGLSPKRTVAFSLADGTRIERQVSECHITLSVGEGHTPVVLGEPGDEALLGVVTLGMLGLVFNSFNRNLLPMRLLLVVHPPTISIATCFKSREYHE